MCRMFVSCWCRFTLPPSYLLLLIFFFPAFSTAQTATPSRLLVVDYAIGYPEEYAGAMSVFTEAGFTVDYRQYYPGLVNTDLLTYDAILLLGGGVPGVSLPEVDLLTQFVARGKLIILATPSNTEDSGQPSVNPGIHDRYLYNLLLNRLNIHLFTFEPPGDRLSLLTKAIPFEPTSGLATLAGLTAPVRARAVTRMLVGSGAEPLLVEPETQQPEPVLAEKTQNATTPESERKFRKRRERIRVQANETKPDEAIELLLRGTQTVRTYLHYVGNRPSVPVPWSVADFKGRVASVTNDTLTIRIPGNRWGSDFATVGVPLALISAAYVDREFTEEVIEEEENTVTELIPTEDTGRPAIAAVGRTDRQGKGFVMVIDRGVLNTFSGAIPPVGMESQEDRASIAGFLAQFGRYANRLAAGPADWVPINPYPPARMPGLHGATFPTNQMTVADRLPDGVRPGTHLRTLSDLTSVEAAGLTKSLRGITDYIVRTDSRTDSLLSLLPRLRPDFFWTNSPSASFTESDVGGRPDILFKNWGQRLGSQLTAAGISWYVSTTPSDWSATGDNDRSAVNARGERVALPSLFDLRHWKESLFDPSRQIARFSLSTPVSGIICDWDTQLPRKPQSYAITDAFEEGNFQAYTRYVAQHGVYKGPIFKELQKLDREQRFEWLLKAGQLEDYFLLLESNAERLGVQYRETITAIQPSLHFGSFMRGIRLNWFQIGFLRGLNTPQHPHLLLTYEQVPAWYVAFLKKHGIAILPVPVALLGSLGPEQLTVTFKAAMSRGGYCLERGAELITTQEPGKGLGSLTDGVTLDQMIEAFKTAR